MKTSLLLDLLIQLEFFHDDIAPIIDDDGSSRQTSKSSVGQRRQMSGQIVKRQSMTMECNKVIRPKSRASALSKKVRQTDKQTIFFQKDKLLLHY